MTISRKGELPIPYIIAMIFAVVVLAIVAYYLFFSSGEFWKIMKEKSCETKKSGYCTDWELTGQPPDKVFSTSCGSITDANRDTYYAPECCNFDWASDGLSAAECGIG